MLAAYATRADAEDPLTALRVGDRPEPPERPGWTTVEVRAAALNHHDLWSLRGVGLPADRLPMILGTDAAGVAPDGTEVVVHSVIGPASGIGPREPRSLLSERYPGTLAERLAVPTANLVPKPAELSFAEAACLPTAWLTAYTMLFTAGRARPGNAVLIQGAGGGVATAALLLGVAAGLDVVVTSRSEAKRDRARALGAGLAVEPGARLPRRVDLVVETVGRATWTHSVRSVVDGGTIVVAGATTGDPTAAELSHVFFRELTVHGVTMGSARDLAALARFVAGHDVKPLIDGTYPLVKATEGLARLASGEAFGKVVLLP